MNFEHSDKVKGLLAQVGAFMDAHIYPNEQAYHDWVSDHSKIWQEWPGMEALKDKARDKAQRFGYAIDVDVLRRARNLYEFDNVFTAPLPPRARAPKKTRSASPSLSRP